MKIDSVFNRILLLLAAVAVVVCISVWVRHARSVPNPPESHLAKTVSGPAVTGGATTNIANAPATPAVALSTHQASKSSELFDWNSDDAMDTNVLRKLAHNDSEYARLADENSRIYRRQLVHHKDTVDMQIQQSKLTGQPLRQLVLPGFDGQEIMMDITQTDLSPSGQQGTFTGHIDGQPDSTVTFAFKGGREAFTILSPRDGIYTVGDPYEPGQIIIKSINPETYVVGNCGNL